MPRSYTTSLSDVFSRQHKLELEWRVELALLKALGEVGKIPAEAHDAIKRVLDSGAVTLARTLEIEKSTHHDIMAMVKAIAEQSPQFGGFVHFGATSQDVNDTVLALQMGECKVRRGVAGGVGTGGRGRVGVEGPRRVRYSRAACGAPAPSPTPSAPHLRAAHPHLNTQTPPWAPPHPRPPAAGGAVGRGACGAPGADAAGGRAQGDALHRPHPRAARDPHHHGLQVRQLPVRVLCRGALLGAR